jgi:hypothetical protein
VWSRGNAAVSAGQGRQRQRGARAATRHRPHPVGRARACRCARRRRRLHQPPPHGFFLKKSRRPLAARRGVGPHGRRSRRWAGMQAPSRARAAGCRGRSLVQAPAPTQPGHDIPSQRQTLFLLFLVLIFLFLAMSLYSGERARGEWARFLLVLAHYLKKNFLTFRTYCIFVT